jgi:hypothetical protein
VASYPIRSLRLTVTARRPAMGAVGGHDASVRPTASRFEAAAIVYHRRAVANRHRCELGCDAANPKARNLGFNFAQKWARLSCGTFAANAAERMND